MEDKKFTKFGLYALSIFTHIAVAGLISSSAYLLKYVGMILNSNSSSTFVLHFLAYSEYALISLALILLVIALVSVTKKFYFSNDEQEWNNQ